MSENSATDVLEDGQIRASDPRTPRAVRTAARDGDFTTTPGAGVPKARVPWAGRGIGAEPAAVFGRFTDRAPHVDAEARRVEREPVRHGRQPVRPGRQPVCHGRLDERFSAGPGHGARTNRAGTRAAGPAARVRDIAPATDTTTVMNEASAA